MLKSGSLVVVVVAQVFQMLSVHLSLPSWRWAVPQVGESQYSRDCLMVSGVLNLWVVLGSAAGHFC